MPVEYIILGGWVFFSAFKIKLTRYIFGVKRHLFFLYCRPNKYSLFFSFFFFFLSLFQFLTISKFNYMYTCMIQQYAVWSQCKSRALILGYQARVASGGGGWGSPTPPLFLAAVIFLKFTSLCIIELYWSWLPTLYKKWKKK